jgi:hypothetical protein
MVYKKLKAEGHYWAEKESFKNKFKTYKNINFNFYHLSIVLGIKIFFNL